jgi:hydroxyacyl-ACP dehydratase HTD2-like protein with hotdog domain
MSTSGDIGLANEGEAIAAWVALAEKPRTVNLEVTARDVWKFRCAMDAAEGTEGGRDLDEQRVPASFFVALGLSAHYARSPAELGPDGVPTDSLPKIPVSRVVAGEQEFQIYEHLSVGDAVVVTERLLECSQRQGRAGWLLRCMFERVYERTSVIVARERYTRIVIR